MLSGVTFPRLGGYREELFQQAEEPDFCLRLVDQARFPSDSDARGPVRHFASPRRNLERAWFYECRNDILFAWHNVPMPRPRPSAGKDHGAHALARPRGSAHGLFARGPGRRLRSRYSAIAQAAGRSGGSLEALQAARTGDARLEDVRGHVAGLQPASRQSAAA